MLESRPSFSTGEYTISIVATTVVSFALALSPTPGCAQNYTLPQFHAAARSTYAGASKPRHSKQQTLAKIIRCQRTARDRRIARKHLKRYKHAHAVRVEWRHFKEAPLPYCTWGHESGPVSETGPEWPPSPRRYTIPNASGSDASGKYQIRDSTWVANGGRKRGKRYYAAAAPPIEQERIARVLYRKLGTQPWSGCG